MNLINVHNLHKSFGKVKALNGIHLEVNKGEIVGFIGPNGAGKSTAIRVLLGILRADSGQAQIFSQDVWEDAVEIHRNVAYVPGDVNLWPNMTGGEVIDLFIRLRGGKESGRREELIERFKLDPTKKCRTYSKGNRQKVALVAAFSTEADLYILDEPTSGLDPLMERVFQECVMEAKERGSSVLLSSHILSEVERLCDKVVIIRDGSIIESGTLDDLRHLTRNRFFVETRESLDGFDEVEGVHELTKEEDGWSFQVDNEYMEDVMHQLTPKGLLRLESMPPKLEDVFMRHYEGLSGGDD
ncbi:ABC transporter ATP-binding protein [Salisediminibacterium selenitireducens]|uniref:ABC transporter related protein n=1 Tax=Bacillus selenitireducens (strain ATCC 700615 / DSM 15326 / MLS10) TaxID=439292 RepID=D6XSL1_BACIE|nr:ABC transporter ATP-binding protein [Salisediminibacterium selenitireducens]ADH98797.1 ABC transporter related protein [[Bacillus] selenitireducens MLS10]